MTLYYLLLFATPFHNDPRLGMVLFDVGGGMIVTPVKVLGLLTVAAAVLAPEAADCAPRLRNPLPLLFVPFAVVPVIASLAFGFSTPTGMISQSVSAALLLVATRPLVTTRERMFKCARTLVLAFAFGSLWVYKQYFMEHASQAWGVEGEPNYEALMLLLTIPMAFWMAQHEQSRGWRRIGLGCGLLLAGAVALTKSRAGIIAGGMMGLLAAIRSKHKLLGLALLAVSALLVFNYGPAGLSQRFQSIKFTGKALNGDEVSTRAHYELLKAGVRMMEGHPVFGVGLGRFKAVAPEYNPEILELAGRSWLAHDTFIQIGAECGVPVLLLFIGMLGVALHNFGIGQRRSDPAWGALGRSMQLGLIGISIAAASISVEPLPFWILISLSHNFREIAALEIPSAAPELLAEGAGRSSYWSGTKKQHANSHYYASL